MLLKRYSNVSSSIHLGHELMEHYHISGEYAKSLTRVYGG